MGLVICYGSHRKLAYEMQGSTLKYKPISAAGTDLFTAVSSEPRTEPDSEHCAGVPHILLGIAHLLKKLLTLGKRPEGYQEAGSLCRLLGRETKSQEKMALLTRFTRGMSKPCPRDRVQD